MKITANQKKKMDALGIAWIEEMTSEEAREAIVDHVGKDEKHVEKLTASKLSGDVFLERSEIDD